MPTSPNNEPVEIDLQRGFWNSWNTSNREQDKRMPEVNRRQARIVNEWIAKLGRTDLDILEIGCGTGWLCEQLLAYGRVTGTDLSNEVLARSQAANPRVRFVPGDFFTLEFPASGFDVIVSLEVLAHVPDQGLFIEKIAHLLRPGGYLMLATQNRFVLERWTGVVPKAPGQIRQWVDAKTLTGLLRRHFDIASMGSIVPLGDRGVLRWTNAPKVDKLLSLALSPGQIQSLKERLYLGHTLMALARKPAESR